MYEGEERSATKEYSHKEPQRGQPRSVPRMDEGGVVIQSCTGDGGRPSGTGCQEQVSNHPKLRWSRAMVVSVREKVPLRRDQVSIVETNASEPPMRCRKTKMSSKPGYSRDLGMSPEGA